MSKRPYIDRKDIAVDRCLHKKLKMESVKRGISIKDVIDELYNEAEKSSEKKKIFDFKF